MNSNGWQELWQWLYFIFLTSETNYYNFRLDQTRSWSNLSKFKNREKTEKGFTEIRTNILKLITSVTSTGLCGSSDNFWSSKNQREFLTLPRPLRRKLRMRCFFDVSKLKESSFFNRTSLTSPQIFYAHPLGNTNLSPSSFHFSVAFYIKTVLSQMVL